MSKWVFSTEEVPIEFESMRMFNRSIDLLVNGSCASDWVHIQRVLMKLGNDRYLCIWWGNVDLTWYMKLEAGQEAEEEV